MLRTLNTLNQLKTLYIGLIGVLVYDFYYGVEPLGGGFTIGVMAAWAYLNGTFFIFKKSETVVRAVLDLLLVPLLLFSFTFVIGLDLKLVVIDLSILEILVFVFTLLIYIIIHLGKIAKKDFKKEGCAFIAFVIIALGIGGTAVVAMLNKFLYVMTQGSMLLLIVISAGFVFDFIRKLVLLIRAEKVKKSPQEWKALIKHNMVFGIMCCIYFFMVA
ncbi:MAG: hypothetical protein WDZ35_00340 [Crocinitomicaceae bacterium]